MGVPISGPSYIYGNSMSVIHNAQRPESTLKTKSNYIFYHTVCDSVAMLESLSRNVGTNKDCDDLSTKIFYGRKRLFHVSNLLYDIYDYLW